MIADMYVHNFSINVDAKLTTISADFLFTKSFGTRWDRLLFRWRCLRNLILHPHFTFQHGLMAPYTIWFQVPSSLANLATYGDSFFLLAVGIAIYTHQDLTFAGSVSDEIVNKLDKFKKYFTYSGSAYTQQVSVLSRNNSPFIRTGEGQFFTLGVDSFYTLLQRLSQVKGKPNLIYVDGYDVSLAQEQLLSVIHQKISHVAKKTNHLPIFMRTNIRDVSDKMIGWGQYHVAALSAAGSILTIRQIAISGESFDSPDWGLRTGADTLFSTKRLQFHFVAHALDRDVKIDKLLHSQLSSLFLHTVRVCWENMQHTPVLYNCSTCQKCLKTKLTLFALGASNTPTFAAFHLEDIRKLRLADHVRGEWKTLYRLLSKKEKVDPALLHTIQEVLQAPGPFLG